MNESSLSTSIERLYDAFRRYRRPARSDFSPFSGITEQDVARLYARPLRMLAAADLETYARHALTTWGHIDELKHYLPRLFELIVTSPGWTDTALLIGLLATGEWRQWPAIEQRAVTDFLDELWKWALEIDPDVLSCGAVLRGFGLSGVDASSALELWTTTTSLRATQQIAVLVLLDRDALLETGALGRQWLSPVREATLQFLLATTTHSRLEAARAACEQVGNRSAAADLAEAARILAWLSDGTRPGAVPSS